MVVTKLLISPVLQTWESRAKHIKLFWSSTAIDYLSLTSRISALFKLIYTYSKLETCPDLLVDLLGFLYPHWQRIELIYWTILSLWWCNYCSLVSHLVGDQEGDLGGQDHEVSWLHSLPQDCRKRKEKGETESMCCVCVSRKISWLHSNPRNFTLQYYHSSN